MSAVAKAVWEVRAGFVPGLPLSELTKRWVYTSEDFAKDEASNTLPRLDLIGYHAVFSKMRAEAMDYCMQMQNPSWCNWAELTYIWY